MRPDTEYEGFLRAMERVTEADVVAALALCPEHIRAGLALGPRGTRYSCGICHTFGKAWYSAGGFTMRDPMWIVWGYHEVPKLHMTEEGQQFNGPLADDVYARCLATYRAAGWTP